jgi:CheY-like chemotaxis protein
MDKFTPTSILIADDDADIRRFLRNVLERAGYAVWEASDGKEAMALAHQMRLDLVILDLIMPEQEGFETIQALKREYPSLKIIAMSGAFSLEQQDGMLRIAQLFGAAAGLSKPFSASTVLKTLRAVLGSAGSDSERTP